MLIRYSNKIDANVSYGELSDGPVKAIGFRYGDHCCSWKRFDKGVGVISFQTHERRSYLSINATETTEGGKSSKETSITMNEAEARILRDWLNVNIKD